LTVLCLPGKECLEVPLYIDIGIKPENITGIEGGSEQARQDFLVNAARYGINPKLGRIENLVDKLPSYDVVSLDFTGPMCKTYLDVIKNLPIKPDIHSQLNTRSYFMIDVMGKRERQVAQDLMEYYSFFTHSTVQNKIQSFHEQLQCRNNTAIHDFVSITKQFAELENDIKAGTVVSDRELPEKRDAALAFMISSLVASTRWADNPTYQPYLQKFYDFRQKGIDCSGIFSDMILNIITFMRRVASEDFIIMLATGISEVVQMATNFRPFIVDIEEYSYFSPVNDSSCPFLTEMMCLHTPLAEYGKLRHIIKFMFDVVVWVAENKQGTYISLRNKNGMLKPTGSSLSRSDVLEFTTPYRQIIASIPINKIVQMDEIMTSIVKKDKLADVILGKNTLKRVDLNDEIKWDSPLHEI